MPVDTGFLAALAARRRFGMKPGLDAIRTICSRLGDPQLKFPAIHIAGTNGKGAVSAMIDSCLRAGGFKSGRYTSPHLVRLNERFFLDGRPLDDSTLEAISFEVERAAGDVDELTFFEALTAVAFLVYSRANVDFAVLETGLGGRLDATNICSPSLCVITRIGLDHCDWLGDTKEKIAAEKAGIIKPGVPVVVGANEPSVVDVFRRRAAEVDAPFHYAPDLASEADIPSGFSLAGTFNRENAVTALAALKILGKGDRSGLTSVVWPGRFQRIGDCIVDGAHNPPAARALARALAERGQARYTLIAGFCGDKDVEETLRILAPFVDKAYAVRTNNPRSISPEALAAKMESVGISAIPCDSLHLALKQTGTVPKQTGTVPLGSGGTVPVRTLICGSLFLAGEALVELGAYPWAGRGECPRFDPSERLVGDSPRT